MPIRAKTPIQTGPLVRVVVYLERAAIEDLELIRRYRHGPQSRSEVVREAVSWLRAKEARWLLGARRQAERREREAAELQAARERSWEQREREALDVMCTEAVEVAREGLKNRVG